MASGNVSVTDSDPTVAIDEELRFPDPSAVVASLTESVRLHEDSLSPDSDRLSVQSNISTRPPPSISEVALSVSCSVIIRFVYLDNGQESTVQRRTQIQFSEENDFESFLTSVFFPPLGLSTQRCRTLSSEICRCLSRSLSIEY